MYRPIIKLITDFGPLLVFFIIYFNNENDLKAAIPPFIIVTLIALIVVYFLERKISIVPLTGGILIAVFGGLTLYFDNKIFFYMKPTIINLLFAGVLFFGRFFGKVFHNYRAVKVCRIPFMPTIIQVIKTKG